MNHLTPHAVFSTCRKAARKCLGSYAAERWTSGTAPSGVCGWFGSLPVLVHEVSWRAWGLRLRRAPGILAPNACLDFAFPVRPAGRGTPNSGFRSSIPCPPVPLFTLRALPRDKSRKTRGQDGSLFLSCKTLSFSASCRFIPAHGRPRLPGFTTKQLPKARMQSRQHGNGCGEIVPCPTFQQSTGLFLVCSAPLFEKE
jgi:hypothetical protein